MDKILARLTKKRYKTKINNMRNEKGAITTDPKDIFKKINKYYEQLYPDKVDNLEKLGYSLKDAN